MDYYKKVQYDYDTSDDFDDDHYDDDSESGYDLED